MVLFLSIFFFIIGFVIIFYSADVFIDNIKDIVKLHNISPFLLGAIFFGIDLEEIIASITASIFGYPTVAVGNVIGNTIIALSLPFAIPALFQVYRINKPPRAFLLTLASLIILYFITLFLSFLTIDVFFISGIIAIGFYLFLLGWNIIGVKKITQKKGEDNLTDNLKDHVEMDDDDYDEKEDHEREKQKTRKKVLFIIGSAFLVILGGFLLGDGLEGIIQSAGISQHIMGYIFVAFGTNIEEFLMVYKSVKKKIPEVATGGMIMKCVWNMGVTFGFSMLINWNVPIVPSLLVNLIILALTIAYFTLSMQKKRIGKKIGTGFIIAFSAYLICNLFVLSA